MCGIVGFLGQQGANQALFDALTVLQHRGQDAAGMVTCQHNRFHLRKDTGLVRDVFRTRHMLRLPGTWGIGHVRYPTAGTDGVGESQPFYVNSPFGLALAHNGNLTNATALKDELFRTDRRHINTDSDSEVLLNVLAQEIHSRCELTLTADTIFEAVTALHQRVRGAYAAVVMIAGYGLVAFRDPFGIRPLVYGRRETAIGSEYLIASESVALDALGFERLRDIAPGEALCIETDGTVHSRVCAPSQPHTPCIFEFVYFARPDSVIDNVSVHKARMRMGELLADKIRRTWRDHDIDVVIPVPESSRSSALQLANRLGVQYREGFIKNRYIARTFIMPGQTQRASSVRQKLNPMPQEFQDKNVLLVDDSIVRGTTSRQIVHMARESGARRVYFASAAPPVRYPNVYGIDIPSVTELIGFGRDERQIAEAIDADWLIYQDLEDLEEAVRRGNRQLKQFENSCFSGEYVTGDISADYLRQLADQRNDSAKQERLTDGDNNVIDLYNTN